MFLQLPLHSGNQLNTPEDARNFLFTLSLIHIALIVGLMLFGGIALVVVGKEVFSHKFTVDSTFKIPALICIATIALSFLIAPVYRKNTPMPANPRNALQQYLVLCMTRWALIEAGALFSGVAIITAKEIPPLAFLVISAAFLAYCYPSKEEFVKFTEQIP